MNTATNKLTQSIMTETMMFCFQYVLVLYAYQSLCVQPYIIPTFLFNVYKRF